MNNTGKSFQKFLLLWSGDFVSSVGIGLTSFVLSGFLIVVAGLLLRVTAVSLAGIKSICRLESKGADEP